MLSQIVRATRASAANLITAQHHNATAAHMESEARRLEASARNHVARGYPGASNVHANMARDMRAEASRLRKLAARAMARHRAAYARAHPEGF